MPDAHGFKFPQASGRSPYAKCAYEADDHQVILGTRKIRLSAASFRT